MTRAVVLVGPRYEDAVRRILEPRGHHIVTTDTDYSALECRVAAKLGLMDCLVCDVDQNPLRYKTILAMVAVMRGARA